MISYYSSDFFKVNSKVIILNMNMVKLGFYYVYIQLYTNMYPVKDVNFWVFLLNLLFESLLTVCQLTKPDI